MWAFILGSRGPSLELVPFESWKSTVSSSMLKTVSLGVRP